MRVKDPLIGYYMLLDIMGIMLLNLYAFEYNIASNFTHYIE